MARITRTPGIDRAFDFVFPVPVKATRAPTSSDLNYPIGQIWVRTDTAQAYILAKIASGSATWSLSSPGASDVDTINTLSPVGGNITIDGGTNITDSNAGNTVTLNLDDAITLATSVTSPIYTASGADLNINSAANQDIIVKMGDAAGGQKVSFTDSGDAEVASIDSNGNFTMAGLTFSSLLTANASATINTAGTALNLATDNSGDAVNIGTGTTIRAIGVGNAGGVAHTVAIGSASAGAITVDTAAGISLDAVTASNFSISGAGADLTLKSSAGSLVLNAEEAVADAISVQSANGGLDLNVALQANLDSSQAAADAVRIVASNAAGGIDIDSGTGGIAVDSTGAISFDGAAASNFSVSGAGTDLTLASAAGRVVINGEEAAADAVRVNSAAGGLDVDVALQMSLVSSQNAADAIVINSSAGGIDITAAGAAGEDLDLVCTAGSVNLQGGEAAADAVRIYASDVAGGIDIDAGTAGIAIDTTGALVTTAAAASTIGTTGAGIDLTLTSNAGSLNLTAGESAADSIKINSLNGGIDILATGAAAGEDIDIVATGSSVNIEATESVSDAIVINASGAAGAVQIKSGTGGVVLDSGLTVNVTAKTNADTPYTVLGSDYVVTGDTSAGVLTVKLPAAPATGRKLIVSDAGGSAGANNITIDGNGKNVSAGGTIAATKLIDSNYGSMLLVYNGTFWIGLDVA